MSAKWKAEENQTQVPFGFPPSVEIALAIPTFPPSRRLLDSFKKRKRKEPSSAIASHRLQAHLWIGKHCMVFYAFALRSEASDREPEFRKGV